MGKMETLQSALLRKLYLHLGNVLEIVVDKEFIIKNIYIGVNAWKDSHEHLKIFSLDTTFPLGFEI